ncbi:MAG: ATP phosphoribosyltransferase regulatory subunit [Lachnospiraceae bacterium]|jgi:ATP phosphoribosyltransferase regulatory subunit|nr:ATP phosphoribosyltransferase regulatory subunit [Lachnospiraceae bacterium]
MNQYIHTPEGVRDIYGREYAARLTVRRAIRSVFHQFGYQDIQTPSFEFFDIFSREKGSVLSREMYKFFDRDGETMVLRPDMTPAIARCAAKYFDEESMPLRLSYIENAFINRTSLQGRLKEFTQAGVEFLGDGSPDADAEILALAIRCLLESGLTRFQIEVGHVGFLKGLLEEARLSEDVENTILAFLENKNFFGIEEQISRCPFSEDLRELFIRLPELFGPAEKISQARTLTKNRRALEAIERLEQVYDVLCCYGLERYVSFDLGMAGRYRYYNGMIFKGYTYGSGEPVVTGGRYDHLMEQFGRRAQAVGFAIVLDSVMAALARQKIPVKCDWPQVMLVYPSGQHREAVTKAGQMRGQGQSVWLERIEANKKAEESGGKEESPAESPREAVFHAYQAKAKARGFRQLCLLWEDGSFSEVTL